MAVVVVAGIAVVLLIVLYPLLAPPTPVPVNLIFRNGTVLTMEEEMPIAQALAIRGDRIEAVGSEGEVLALQEADTRIVDLEGRTVLPGFIDSHAHWIGVQASTAQEAIQAALENGWTSISELSVNQERLDELRALDETGDLRVRVNAYLPLNRQFERFGDWYKAYEPGQEYSSKLRVAGVKVFMDMAPGTNIGYEGRSYFFDQEELDGLLAEAHEAGFQIAVHSIVDMAIDIVLNSFEWILPDRPDPQHRHRIEHAVMLRDDQISRMKDLGIVASIQLSWFDSDWTEGILRDVGPEQASLVGRWRDLVEAGVHVIGSTDTGRTQYGSMEVIYSAVTRVGEQGLPPPSWMLDQRITVEQALRLLTIDAAYGTFQEDVKGSLAPGKMADLVILSENPLAVPAELLKDIDVLVTMVGGRAEYCAPGAEALCAQPAFTGLAWVSILEVGRAPVQLAGRQGSAWPGSVT